MDLFLSILPSFITGKQQENFFKNIPDDTIFQICSFLNLSDFKSFICTCKRNEELSRKSNFNSRKYFLEFSTFQFPVPKQRSWFSLNSKLRDIDPESKKSFEIFKSKGINRVLITGIKYSGAITFMNQLKLYDNKTFPFLEYSENIRKECLHIIKCILFICEIYQISIQNSTKLIWETSQGTLSEIGECISHIWKNDQVKNSLKENTKVEISSYADYFMDNVPRIFSSTYIPTPEDIIRTEYSENKISGDVKRKEIDFIYVPIDSFHTELWNPTICQNQSIVFFACIDEFPNSEKIKFLLQEILFLVKLNFKITVFFQNSPKFFEMIKLHHPEYFNGKSDAPRFVRTLFTEKILSTLFYYCTGDITEKEMFLDLMENIAALMTYLCGGCG